MYILTIYDNTDFGAWFYLKLHTLMWTKQHVLKHPDEGQEKKPVKHTKTHKIGFFFLKDELSNWLFGLILWDPCI